MYFLLHRTPTIEWMSKTPHRRTSLPPKKYKKKNIMYYRGTQNSYKWRPLSKMYKYLLNLANILLLWTHSVSSEFTDMKFTTRYWGYTARHNINIHPYNLRRYHIIRSELYIIFSEPSLSIYFIKIKRTFGGLKGWKCT